MRGQKHTDETRIKAMELLSVYSVADVARQLNLPETTVRTWAKGETKASKADSEHLVELRNKRKQEFVEGAWDIIDKAKQLIDRRLTRALQQESEIDELLENAEKEIDEMDCPQQRKAALRKSVAQRVASLKLEDLKELSVTLGTLYDKQALANNEATVNAGIKITLGEGLDKYAD